MTLKRAKTHCFEHYDDERNIGNGIIVTLKRGFQWGDDKNCHVRGFDSVADLRDDLWMIRHCDCDYCTGKEN